MNARKSAVVLALVFVLSGLVVVSQPTQTGPAGLPGNAHLRPALGPQCVSPFSNTSLTITNSQTVSTGYYQQHFYLDAALFPSLTANLSNLEFVYANGTLINAWIENNASNAATAANIWLEQDSIAAGSSRVIYMLVCRASVFSQNGPTGMNASLTGTYGALDDGWRVFNIYTNWSGTTTPSGWAHGTCNTYSVSNGLTIRGSGSACIVSGPAVLWSNRSWMEIYAQTGSIAATPALGTEMCASTALMVCGAFSGIGQNKFEGPTGAIVFGTPHAGVNYVLSAGGCPATYACGGGRRAWSEVNYTNTSYGTFVNPSTSNSLPIIYGFASTSVIQWARERTLEYRDPVVSGLGPSAPIVTAAAINTTAIAVSWLAPPGIIVNYTLMYAHFYGLPIAFISVGNGTTYNLTGLGFGLVYYITVWAWSLSGQGAPSNVAVAQTNPLPPVVTPFPWQELTAITMLSILGSLAFSAAAAVWISNRRGRRSDGAAAVALARSQGDSETRQGYPRGPPRDRRSYSTVARRP